MAGEEFPINVDDYIEREKGIKQANELVKASTSTSQPKEIYFWTDELSKAKEEEVRRDQELIYKEEVRRDQELIYKLSKGKEEEVRIDQQDMVTIQRAPKIMLRNKEFEEYFKPMELSIGPLHAEDPKLFKEELKLELAA